jgi:PAS domain S-box-containing protein
VLPGLGIDGLVRKPIWTDGPGSPIDGLALLDAIDVAVVAMNTEMVITYCNPAVTLLLGWTSDHPVERRLSELLTTADPKLAAARLAVFTHAETWSGLVSVERADGFVLGLRFTFSPVRNGYGEIVGGVAIISEVAKDPTGDEAQSALAPIRVMPPRQGSTQIVPITVLLATDSLLVGQGLNALFSNIPAITVVGLARDQAELVRLCTDLVPQAVIISIRSPSVASENMVVAARQLRTDFPDLGLVLISDCGNGFALELLRDGASRIAYLLSDQLPTIETVVDAVHEVTGGQSVLDPSIVDFLMNHRNDNGVDDLTNRETDVLELIAEGCSNREIADRLHISVKTIEKCVTSIFRNLAVVDLSRVDRRVAATLSFQRARTSGLEKELRRIRKGRSPLVVTPRRGDALNAMQGHTTLGA